MNSQYVTRDNSVDLNRLLEKVRKEFKSECKTKLHQIRIENFQKEQDGYFIKHILTPYLSSVYFGLLARSNKDYLSCNKTKHYLNMPELIGDRLVRQMNANGDERIDHDEFVKFFLKLLMGSLEQKMLIAFRVYDVDGDDVISDQEVKVVLRNVPIHFEERYGSSFEKIQSRYHYLQAKEEDNMQIQRFLDLMFKEYKDKSMYFDEFQKLATEVTSELFVSVYYCVYQYIPCVKNYLILRENYIQYLQQNKDVTFKSYTYQILMPPITKKMMEKMSEVSTDNSPKKPKRNSGLQAFKSQKSQEEVSPNREKVSPDNRVDSFNKSDDGKQMKYLDENAIQEEDEISDSFSQSLTEGSNKFIKVQKIMSKKSTACATKMVTPVNNQKKNPIKKGSSFLINPKSINSSFKNLLIEEQKEIESFDSFSSTSSAKNEYGIAGPTQDTETSPRTDVKQRLFRSMSIVPTEKQKKRPKWKKSSLKEFIQEDTDKVHDGFQIPLRAKIIRMMGSYCQKTHKGYYLNSFLVLKNSELYLYDNSENMRLQQMLVLTPQVFVSKLKEISHQSPDKDKCVRYFPVELYLGGNTGNNGVEKSQFHNGNANGIITLFFETPSNQNKWCNNLQKITGSYFVKDFYQYCQKIQKKELKKQNSLHSGEVSPAKINVNDLLGRLENQDLEIGEDCQNNQQDHCCIIGDQKLDEILGQGKQSIICKGIHKESRQEVAIKIIQKKGMCVHKLDRVRDMISILKVSQHHNVVRLEDYFESREYFFICLELHSKMSLFEFINKYQDQIEEKRAQELGRKIGQALEHLHENGIMLKNLESSGILMTESDNMLEKSIPRISRFDKAEICGYSSIVHNLHGDPLFRAPEVLLGKHYGFRADSWSFGVIMYQLLAGRLPFSKEEEILDFVNIDELSKYIISRGHHQQSVDLISKLMQREPSQRMPISVAMKHKWFSMKLDIAGRSFDGNAQETTNLIQRSHQFGRKGSDVGLKDKSSRIDKSSRNSTRRNLMGNIF